MCCTVFMPTRLFGTPGGTIIVNMDNDEIFNVTKDELPKEMKADVEKVIREYELKLLLSNGCTHDKKIY